jgi:magnesium chelatase subunit D
MSSAFPFSAVVGHDDFKLAMLANAVDPRIGGVLAVGDRGSAKTTVARSFAALLPALGGPEAGTAPFVNLPLGATLDRVTGSIDTGKLLEGEGIALQPGLLAEADGGVLYVDEVNLLGDHLVDVLLDAAAFGLARVERDGISAELPARFVLIGTMNPEEGDLRPQLLDRFGLYVPVRAPSDTASRTTIVNRRIAYERDPQRFADQHQSADSALRERIHAARQIAHAVDLPEVLLAEVSTVCTKLGVEGLRADIVIARTAAALAALDERLEASRDDVLTAARLALPHRARCAPTESRRFSASEITSAFAGDDGSAEMPPIRPRTAAGRHAVQPPRRDETQIPARVDLDSHTDASATGRGASASGGARPSVDAVPAGLASTIDLDAIATARAAVTRRLVSGDAATSLVEGDLMQNLRSGRQANLVLCVVDASSSVFERGQTAQLRALLGGLVADARRKRDRIGLIVFRGREARLVAPPSRNHEAVLAGLDTVEPGGTTPLAEGILVAQLTAQRELRRNPDLSPVVALVTDGYANIARSGDALTEAISSARELVRSGVGLIVIGEPSSGAPQFARAAGGQFHPFVPETDSQQVA